MNFSKELLSRYTYGDYKCSALYPDVAIVYNNRGEKITITPKTVFNFVSPSMAKIDKITKKGIYERKGIPFYVLFYPHLKKVKVFKLSPKGVYKKLINLLGDRFSFDLEGCPLSPDFDKILEV